MENKKEITFGKYRFETFEEERNGKLFYFAKKYRSTPKGKYLKEKCEYYYRYSNPVDRDSRINADIESLKRQEVQKQAVKEKLADMKKNFQNPFKVGDLFYDSWGYDQTNIDFYQIVEVGRASVKLSKIKQIYLESAGDMCEYVAPAKDDFVGEPFLSIIQLSRYDFKPRINGRHGSIMPIGEREKFYQSHYA